MKPLWALRVGHRGARRVCSDSWLMPIAGHRLSGTRSIRQERAFGITPELWPSTLAQQNPPDWPNGSKCLACNFERLDWFDLEFKVWNPKFGCKICKLFLTNSAFKLAKFLLEAISSPSDPTFNAGWPTNGKSPLDQWSASQPILPQQ